jgi:hypothetical protein
MSPNESEKSDRGERLDWAKGLSGVLAALTFVFGVITFLHQSDTQAKAQLDQRRIEEQNRKAEQVRALDLRDRELSEQFRKEQFSLYQKAMDSAATLATRGSTDPSDATVRQALQDFWGLYWGKLAMVESAGVVKAMVDFGSGLNRCGETSKPDADCQKCLKFFSLGLAHRCRESVSAQWGTKLDELPEQPETLKYCREWAGSSQ